MGSIDRKYFPRPNTPLLKSRLLRSLSKRPTSSKQEQFHDLSREEFAEIKQKYGYGVYSYALGMSRRSARLIARKRARTAMRGQAQSSVSASRQDE